MYLLQMCHKLPPHYFQIFSDRPDIPLRVPSPVHHFQHRLLGRNLLLAVGRLWIQAEMKLSNDFFSDEIIFDATLSK